MYGWEELIGDDGSFDDETTNMLTLFVGVMFGVNGAANTITKLSASAAQRASKSIASKALTKGTIFPIVKKIAQVLGIKMTKDTFAKGVSKAIPVIGGIASGGLTYVTYKPMAYKLKNHLESLKWCDTSYYANLEGSKIQSYIFRKAEGRKDENRHVAILSKDGWRCGHGHSWDAHFQCRLDIDFMEEEKYQEIFDKLFNTFALRNEKDDLAYKFINLFILYSRGIVQCKIHHDDSLALLLFITALESLITEGQQEKRLRLAAIIPKLISIDGMTSFELATMIDELYKDRNNFVHAGQTPSYSYKNNKLETLERVTALMILKYFEADSLLNISSGQTRIKAWTEYLNNVFNGIIFGQSEQSLKKKS